MSLTVLGLESPRSKIKALADLAPSEGLLSGSQMAISSLCSHMEERGEGAFEGLFL